MFLLEWIRVILSAIWTSIVCGIATIMSLLKPFDTRIVSKVGAALGRGTLWICNIKIEIEGLEHYKDAHPAIIISNHQSNLDAFVCGRVLQTHTVSIGKESIKWIPFFGTMYWLTGNIFINRSNKRSAFESMAKAAKQITERNVSVWILPEGTRSYGRGVLPFKKGAFFTAINAQRPVVSVCISQYHKNIDLKQWKAGTVRVKILPPIDTAGMVTPGDVQGLMDKCQSQLSDCVANLDKQNEDEVKTRLG